jgi:hypothetical protein
MDLVIGASFTALSPSMQQSMITALSPSMQQSLERWDIADDHINEEI